jgi:murein DD-endopeptidase MepM/ murein hydrolase activator NlpD
MKNQPTIWQRLGGHLVLLLLALLIFLGRSIIASANLITGPAEPSANLQSPISLILTPTPLISNLQSPITPTIAFDPDSVPVLQDSSLVPAANPYTYQGQRPDIQYQTYVVERGDTPNAIAEKFGIQPETLLGGNPLLSQESNALMTGTELIILPVDGVLHDVREGDTLEGVAEEYSIPVADIVAYAPNNLEFPYRLYPNTQILVPGAVRQVFVWTAPPVPSRPSAPGNAGGAACTTFGTGGFIWPVSARRITQYFWYGHPGIDIALGEGSSVVAADSGIVSYATWNFSGYGNLVVINHCNGYETYYAHLSSIGVYAGQAVSQGQYIAASGNTGRSSGPHLHFEIRLYNGQLDPFGYLP